MPNIGLVHILPVNRRLRYMLFIVVYFPGLFLLVMVNSSVY